MYIQIITIIFVIILLSRVAAKLKRREITLNESLFWGLLWLAVGIVVLYPRLTDKLALAIGLQTAHGIDLVVYVAVAVVFYLVFRVFVRLEKIEREITKIIRHLAIRDKQDK